MFDQPFVALPQIVASHGRYRGAMPALADAGREIDWRECNRLIDSMASAFAALGVKQHDSVAFLAVGELESAVAMLAAMRIGAVVVPLSPMLPVETLALMAADCGAKLLVTAPVCAPLADALSQGTPALKMVAVGELASFAGSAPRPEIASDDDCNIIYSSGTTGTPKGIVHSQISRALGAMGLAIEFRIDRTAVTLLATPLFTNGTWMTWLPTVLTGGKCVMLPRFDAGLFLEAVERHRVTHVFMVPTMIRALLDHPDIASRDLSSLRVVVSAGSTLPIAWKREAIARLGGRLLELYGLTEGIGTTLHPEDMETKADTVGTPIAGTDLRIIGDDGAELAPGEIGEIVGYGGGLMARYHNRPDATEDAIWRDADARTFLRTGDMGSLDEDGFLRILDRKKDMIVSGGVNVFAADIEAVFRQHPAVADVAVIGVPHEKWVETPVALVRLNDGAALHSDELAVWANSRLGKHQRVDRVIPRDKDFPRNALGKVLKRELRETIA